LTIFSFNSGAVLEPPQSDTEQHSKLSIKTNINEHEKNRLADGSAKRFL